MRGILFCKTLRNLRKTKHTDGMKKLFCVSALLAAVWIDSAAGAGLCARAYEVERTVISEKTAVIDGKPVEVRLSGVGKTYITEIRLDVLQGGKPVCSIVPPNDFGFDPFIGFYEFSKGEPFLFYSAQSGGSGGYGFYNVYRLTGEKCRQVYDQAQDSAKNRFAGEFIDGCKMVLQNLNEKNSLTVDVGYMAPEFLKLIFPADCRPAKQEININDISIVFPYFNSAMGVYQLSTYRSVTAVAEVNRLGYISQNLELAEGGFTPYFTNFLIGF